VEELYNIVEVIHEENGQGETNTIVMGEWESMDDGWRKIIYIHCSNTWTGKEKSEMSNAHRISERNGLVFTNTWFRKPNITLYTWKTPSSGDRNRHHLDYTLVNFQCRNKI